MAAEPDATAEIIQRCVRLPLALSIVAARAAVHPTFPLATFAAELRDTRNRLDALAGGDATTDVRAVFSWSYHALRHDAASMFRLLGLHPGPDITAAAAASLAALPLPRVRVLLGELARANLIVEHVPGRYTFHDLLRAYATDLVHQFDTDEQRLAGTHRLLDHYLHSAYHSNVLLDPNRDPIALSAARAGVTLQQSADGEQAMAWFTAEHPVLLAAIDHAAATGFDTHTWQLAWTLTTFLYRRGRWHDWVVTLRAAIATADRLADPAAQAFAHRNLASVTKEGTGIYVFHADTEGVNFRRALVDAGWKLAQCCVWVKQTLVMGRKAGGHTDRPLSKTASTAIHGLWFETAGT